MIKNLLQEGFALKNRGHYKHAIEVFYKALELDNTSSELLLEIADLYYKMQNEERALNYIEQILDKNPEDVEPYILPQSKSYHAFLFLLLLCHNTL